VQTNPGCETLPPLESSAKDAGLYLYFFTRSGAVREIGSAAMKEGPLLGAIEFGDVAAVFSPVPLGEFVEEGGRKNFQDPAWVVPRACRHDRVIKHVMEYFPVLPVRFGAVFTSPECLQDQLAKNGPEISWFLDHMSNKEEWSVKAFGHLEKTGAWLLRTDPELLSKRRQAPASPGARYLHDRHLAVRAAKQARQVWRAAAGRLQDELAGHALKLCPLPLRRRNPSEREDEMIFHSAFLLDRECVTDFRARVESLEADLRERGLTFEACGPWPPYNFSPSIVTGEGAA
jgi:hypothetical protein